MPLLAGIVCGERHMVPKFNNVYRAGLDSNYLSLRTKAVKVDFAIPIACKISPHYNYEIPYN